MIMMDMKPKKDINLIGNILNVRRTNYGATILSVKNPQHDGLYDVMISGKRKGLSDNTEFWKENLLNKKVSMLCTITFARSGDMKGNTKFHFYIHLDSAIIIGNV